jgi:HJR/Mrr/RecB family endonuclease
LVSSNSSLNYCINVVAKRLTFSPPQYYLNIFCRKRVFSIIIFFAQWLKEKEEQTTQW